MNMCKFIFYGFLLSSSLADLTEVYVGLNNLTKPIPLQPGSNDLVVGDQFGHAVAIWGRRCIVSATRRAVVNSGHPQSDGVVYVFEQNDQREWLDAGYTLSSFVDGDGYGESLAIFDKTVAVGAPRDDSSGANSGRAYVYSESSGSGALDRSQVLYVDHAEPYDYFGFSVAVIPGDGYYPAGTVVVGAYGHSYAQREHKVAEAGCVFIFPYSGSVWFMSVVLQPSQPYENGFFGWSVSGYGNAVAVGAPGQEAVFVFRIEPIRRECPHDGKPEDMPDDCRDQQQPPHRRVQAGAPPGHTYTSWEYVEVLHVQNDLDDYKGDKFGQSVSVINQTALTVVVGAPSDNDKGSAAGAVYILSLLPKGDVWSSWSPEHPDDHNHHHRHLRRALQEAPPAEGEEHHEEDHHDEHHQNIWNIRSYSYSSDKDGEAWMLMAKMYGKEANEFYGYCSAVSDSHILVGVFGGPYKKGRAELLVFNSTDTVDTDSPIFQGPLYQKKWMKESVLVDSNGGQGDYFGSALSLYEGMAVVGGFLTGFASNDNIGTGAAYIYDGTQLMSLSSAHSLSESGQGGTLALVGAVFLVLGKILVVCLLLAGVGALLMYRSKSFGSSFSWLSGIVNPDPYMDITQSSNVDESSNSRAHQPSSRGGKHGHDDRRSDRENSTRSFSSSRHSRRADENGVGGDGKKKLRNSSLHRGQDSDAESVRRTMVEQSQGKDLPDSTSPRMSTGTARGKYASKTSKPAVYSSHQS